MIDYIIESMVRDFLKILLIGAGFTIIMLLVLVLVIWGIAAGLINYPKTSALVIFLLFSIAAGYDYRRTKS